MIFLWLAQLVLRPVYPVVVAPPETLYNAWAGGWQSPQFSTLDVDGDGEDELLTFDRVDDKLLLFKRQGRRWMYLAEGDSFFPVSFLSGWVLLRDYDGDGDKDLFTNVNSNIRVFENIAPSQGSPRWRLAYDTLRSEYTPGFFSYLYAARIDIPAITDVDNDGDVDLLVYEVLGTLIECHKNEAMEQLGRRDTFLLRLQSGCWGGVYEVYDYNQNTFSFVQYECGSSQREEARTAHAGGTLLIIDLNGDGLKDLIVGDDGPPYLIAGLNTGTNQEALIDAENPLTPYPPAMPLYLPSFPAAYYEDVTGDGKPDLICANNSAVGGESRRSVWMYENVGSAEAPLWAAPARGWLHSSMLDVGRGAHPTLADLNRDGYPDLIISCEQDYTETGPVGRAFLLWGIPGGFTLADTNWLGLTAYVLRNPVFTAGDINGNGRTDLIMGTSTGALWHWEEQQAGSANFILLSQNFANISAPPFATPLLYDYDEDGDLDLIVGGRNGRLALYRHENDSTFRLITDFLGEIEMRDTLSTLLGFTRPALTDIDGDGEDELIVGNMTGFLRVYEPQWRDPLRPWIQVMDLPYRWGKRASPTAWRDTDSLLILVGNLRGGLHAFTLASEISTPIFPKSADHLPYVLRFTAHHWELFTSYPALVRVYNLRGELVSIFTDQAHCALAYPPGVYIVVIQIGDQTFIERILAW
ncbi:MAG: T9SS type A sorting domain-containing protein [Bacteroidia bacterium]|nr:T9SS type A sorting domain-containing protein [Bacteroidia bacterium]MDW8015908.1 T9SS type A sorting domain-containing protein [Bacteroidia bacterium]